MIYRRLVVLFGSFLILFCTGGNQHVSKPLEAPETGAVEVGASAGTTESIHESPHEMILRIRSAGNAVDLTNGLKALGFSRDDLARLAEEDLLVASGHRLFETESLKLAEVFHVNLDGDTAEEYVSQVILEPEPDLYYRARRIVYFIALHDHASSGYANLHTLIFDEKRCDEYPERPLTFRFESLADQPAQHKVIFDRIRTKACGIRQRSFYRQHDTLVVANGAVDLRPGTPYDKK